VMTGAGPPASRRCRGRGCVMHNKSLSVSPTVILWICGHWPPN